MASDAQLGPARRSPALDLDADVLRARDPRAHLHDDPAPCLARLRADRPERLGRAGSGGTRPRRVGEGPLTGEAAVPERLTLLVLEKTTFFTRHTVASAGGATAWSERFSSYTVRPRPPPPPRRM